MAKRERREICEMADVAQFRKSGFVLICESHVHLWQNVFAFNFEFMAQLIVIHSKLNLFNRTDKSKEGLATDTRKFAQMRIRRQESFLRSKPFSRL
jgi:hypothetical protein